MVSRIVGDPPPLSLLSHLSSVCPSQKPPCVDSKRPRVYRHHARMWYHMCAWCRYTRGRFESTHGGFFCVPSRATHHTTQHNTTPHTPHNTTTHNTTRRQRQRQRETEKEDRNRERQRETEKEKTRQEKRRRDNKREETRR